MTRISSDFEEKKVPLLGRRGREAPRCRPGGTFQIKGIGGVQGDLSDFLLFGICCSPGYEDSKMGSCKV